MDLYFIIAAAALAISAAITFAAKVVTKEHVAAHLILFPLVYLAMGLPIDGIWKHLIAAGALYVTGSIVRKFGGIGGGVVHAFVIVGLWAPTTELLLNFLCLALIFGGIYALLAMAVKLKSLEHYAAMALAVGCGVFAYSYDIPLKPGVAVADTAQAESVNLRGTSKSP